MLLAAVSFKVLSYEIQNVISTTNTNKFVSGAAFSVSVLPAHYSHQSRFKRTRSSLQSVLKFPLLSASIHFLPFSTYIPIMSAANTQAKTYSFSNSCETFNAIGFKWTANNALHTTVQNRNT